MLRFLQRTSAWAAVLWLTFTPTLLPPIFAQDIGTVSLRTIPAQLASNVTCTGAAQNFITGAVPGFNNLGQTQHQVSARSAAGSFTVEIDGIDVIGTIIRISNPTVSFSNGATIGYVAQGTGYYPNIQVTVVCSAGATFSMSYSGSSGGQTPIIAAPGSTPTVVPTFAGNVQGIVAPGINGSLVNPIVSGALGIPTNQGFTAVGVDNFSTNSFVQNNGFTGAIVIGTPPLGTNSTDFGMVVYNTAAGAGGGTGLAAPWTCVTACGAGISVGNAAPEIATLPNVSTANKVISNQINTGGPGNWNTIFVLFAAAPTIRQTGTGGAAVSTPGNTQAGSTLMVFGQCTNFPCQIDSVTDTQANPNWKQIAAIQNPSGTAGGLNVWIASGASAAAETATFNAHAGTTLANTEIIELTNVTPANPNQPSLPLFMAPNAASGLQASPNENDQGGLFTEAGGYSFTQSLTVTANATVKLWQQARNGVFSSCLVSERITAASGTTPTLNMFLQDSPDGVQFNDRLSMPQGTAAATFIGAVPGFTAGNLTPTASSAVVSTSQALAAGNAVAGPIGPFGQMAFVVGGTTPSFTLTYNVNCK